MDAEFEKSPKLIVTGELRKANDFLRRILQANSQTWIAPKGSKFFVNPSSHSRHYADLFTFRKVSSEINKNTSKLPRDALALIPTSTLSLMLKHVILVYSSLCSDIFPTYISSFTNL